MSKGIEVQLQSKLVIFLKEDINLADEYVPFIFSDKILNIHSITLVKQSQTHSAVVRNVVGARVKIPKEIIRDALEASDLICLEIKYYELISTGDENEI